MYTTVCCTHLNRHGGLLVLVGGEHLALLGGDHSVAGNELGHHTTNSLNAQGQGRHIEQQDVLHLIATLTTQNATLQCINLRGNK
jgi:hypothetical protein